MLTLLRTWKRKLKFHPRTGHEGLQKEKRYRSPLSWTSALNGGGWLTPRPGRFTPRKETRYPLYRRLSGPEGRCGQVRTISPPPGFDPRTIQPVASCCTNFSFYYLVLSLYFIRACVCVFIVLLFAFCPYCATQTSTPLAGFKPATPASDRPQILTLDRSATGIGAWAIADLNGIKLMRNFHEMCQLVSCKL